MKTVASADLQLFANQALVALGVRSDIARHVAEGLTQASLRGVDSHGVRLLPHYVRALDAGRLNPNPQYDFQSTSTTTGRLDADHTFGHAAGAEGMGRAIELARKGGLGAVAVHNSSHFGAAAYFSLMAACQRMIGLSFTHADALVLSHGGKRPFFGTNPICFAAPCRDEEPFCLDTATSTVTWNKLLRVAEESGEVPEGWGVDAQGQDTRAPRLIAALHPIGGYKGFGLGMMVDVLCGVLTGMPFGPHISRMYADPIEQKRRLGHFFMAIDIECFVPVDEFETNMKQMMDELRQEPALNTRAPVQVAGDPEKRTAEQRRLEGINLSVSELEELQALAHRCGIPFPSLRKEALAE